MTIDEAIKALEANELVYRLASDTLGADATRLGIEALKKIKEQRSYEGWVGEPLLPGETEK